MQNQKFKDTDVQVVEVLNETYQVIKLYANEVEDGMYGDIYLAAEDVREDYPNAVILEGYGLYKAAGVTNYCEGKDWYETLEEVRADFEAEYQTDIPEVIIKRDGYECTFSVDEELLGDLLKTRTMSVLPTKEDQFIFGVFGPMDADLEKDELLMQLTAFIHPETGEALIYLEYRAKEYSVPSHIEDIDRLMEWCVHNYEIHNEIQVKERRYTTVRDIVDVLKKVKNPMLPIYARLEGQMIPLAHQYIEMCVWQQGTNPNKETLFVSELMVDVVDEAHDDAWRGSIYHAPYDRVCECTYVVDNNEFLYNVYSITETKDAVYFDLVVEKYCPKCNTRLELETEDCLLAQGYKYVCHDCDENFFEFESK